MPDEPADEKENEIPQKMVPLGETTTELNGEFGSEGPPDVGCPTEESGGDQVEERSVSPAVVVCSSSGAVKVDVDPAGRVLSDAYARVEVMVSKPTPNKGYGLKKWRRVRRDFSKDERTSADSSQIMKRKLQLVEPSKGHDSSKHKSDDERNDEPEGSVASMVSMNIGGVGCNSPAITTAVLDQELGLLVRAGGFSIGIDSENSDDQSIKSSTAASAPKLRYEAIGFGRDRSRARPIGGRGSGHIGQQRGQRPKGGRTDGNRKPREDRAKIDMENSYSSVESNLRASCAPFTHMDTIATHSKLNEKFMINNGDQNDDAEPNEELRSSFYEDNRRAGDLSREESGEENNMISDNSQAGDDFEPFLESIVSLQAAKEGLEDEIRKLQELRKDEIFDDGDTQCEVTAGISSVDVGTDLLELNHKIGHLEWKLEEAIAEAKAKESKAIELEETVKMKGSINKEQDSTKLSLPGKCKEIEIELDNLLKNKIEAEIEYLILKRATQTWRILAEDQIALFEEQNALLDNQSNGMLKAQNAENKYLILKKRADKSEKDLWMAEEALRLRSRALNYSFCLFFQVVLLCVVFVLFIKYFLPSSGGVTPT